MTNEEAIAILEEEAEFLYGEDKPHNRTAFDMAIKALSAEREKGEYIKKEDAIAEFKAQKDAWEYYGEIFYNEKYIKKVYQV